MQLSAWLLIILLNNVPTVIPFTDKKACESAGTSISTKFKKKYSGHVCISQISNT